MAKLETRCITSDGESAFKSKEAETFYKDKKIEFITVERLQSNYRPQYDIDSDDKPDTAEQARIRNLIILH